ncbi:MAG: ABC transporter substrate-binding protein, partial [Rhodobiaceae bacterium]|nr:ABC transporter substrate-binding protein [Rhodobiaceae bacterium]
GIIMAFKNKFIVGAFAAASFALAAGGAQADGVKIGFLSDLTGASSVLSGESSVTAIKMAIEDSGDVLGKPVELVVADQLNKPDVGLAIARQWIDTEGVTAILDVNNSAVALAVNDLTTEKNIIFLDGGSTTKLTNENCSVTTTQWIIDTYGLARAIALPLVKAGNDNWFFITVDYAFGHDLEAKGIAAVESAGGKVVGTVRHSPQTTDYSSFLLEAQSKGAKTIALATFGSYMINIIKQAREFGMDVKMVPFFMAMTDIKSIGLENLKNVSGGIMFYWDRNDKTRAWSKRYEERFGRPATFSNAQQYNAVIHYLKAVKAAGTTEAKAVAAKMLELPVEDQTDVSAYVRKDGRVARDMYSFDVKTPEESKGEWDVMKITATADKEDVTLPLSESKCPLVNK